MSDSRKIFLTFDDGPSQPYTEEILNILDRHNSKATFFVSGKNVERLPAVVKNIYDRGHSIGNHAYSHNRWRSYTGALQEEINSTQIAIKRASGQFPSLFRPPYGVMPFWSGLKIKDQGLKTVLWDIKVYDWLKLPPEFMVHRIIEKIFPGAVVLLHDGEGVKEKCNRSNTVKVVDQLLTILKPQGWEFEKL